MSSWYDYLPVVGAVDSAVHGDWKGALGNTLLPGIYPAAEAYKGAVNEQKAGLQNASTQSAALANQIYGETVSGPNSGLSQAESYFAPAQAYQKAAYGDPGAMTGGPSMYPPAAPRPR